ncbi:hypothetical protein N7463_008471 [Penicillium fimorum]|uniref:Uncharacterized protein n=1 Tax=Penicillium fimorum TaxID=1882269 RepID=A0A9W9XNZ1_9EURO|nr:hypothetical protein N7463_008471 [Penicillium fimorum]
MHISYISLALFAIGAIAAPAAPAAPKPSSEVDETATGFPFAPIGSNIEDTEKGFGQSFSSALEEMKKSAQHAASQSNLPTATTVHDVASFPTPVVSQASTLSHAAHVASQAPEVSNSASTTPTPKPAPSESGSASTTPTPKPTPSKSDSASSSSTVAPSPAKPTKSDPIGGALKGLPLVGNLLGAPMAALGLGR